MIAVAGRWSRQRNYRVRSWCYSETGSGMNSKFVVPKYDTQVTAFAGSVSSLGVVKFEAPPTDKRKLAKLRWAAA